MAKEIKAIKCPNCGSVNKLELKPDFYKCSNCQTEYFLDDNDVNINYNHNFNNSNQFGDNSKAIKTVAIVIGCIIGAFILFAVLIGIFSSNKQKNTPTYSTSSANDDEDDFYTIRYKALTFLKTSTKQPIILAFEERRYNAKSNDSRNGNYLSFYNPFDKKLIAEEKVNNESHSHSEFKFRTFSDGNIYIINNKATFLKLNQETFKTEDVGKKYFEANPELQIGAATIEFVYDNYGDGLVLLTNDGKKRYYYPFVQKLYTEKEFRNACEGFNNLLPTAKNKTIHVFTSQSTDYPEDKLQLIQLTYLDNGPGAKDVADHLAWGKDFGGSGIFTDNDPYRKLLIAPYEKKRNRILNWKDITPDRLYFAPSVIIDEGEDLLIQFRADANEKSAFKLQKLNKNSGTIEWTTALPAGKKLQTITKYKDGFVGVCDGDQVIVLDTKGTITSNYKLD